MRSAMQVLTRGSVGENPMMLMKLGRSITPLVVEATFRSVELRYAANPDAKGVCIVGSALMNNKIKESREARGAGVALPSVFPDPGTSP